MIIHGIRSSFIANENLAEQCPNCKAQLSLRLSIFQKYIHIFWLPFFAFGKTGNTECLICLQKLKPKEMPVDIRLSYDNLKRQSKTPLWTYSGAFIIIIFPFFLVKFSIERNKEDLKLITSPQPHDVYEVKTTNKKYTLYKVSKISGDTVFILKSALTVSKLTNLISLNNKGGQVYLNASSEAILKKDLIKLFEKDEIINVVRDKK